MGMQPLRASYIYPREQYYQFRHHTHASKHSLYPSPKSRTCGPAARAAPKNPSARQIPFNSTLPHQNTHSPILSLFHHRPSLSSFTRHLPFPFSQSSAPSTRRNTLATRSHTPRCTAHDAGMKPKIHMRNNRLRRMYEIPRIENNSLSNHKITQPSIKL